MFHAVDPRTGALGEWFEETSPEKFDQLLAAATSAAASRELAQVGARADALTGTACRLRLRAAEIIASAQAETGLPAPRLEGELERTCVQLEMLAEVILAGDHLEVIIDHAAPQAAPVPRPDIRRMLVPLGPVAVFGASNFPLAFSTAGGDTAAALAAGCPVIVKGHPSHPGTGTLVAAELDAAVAEAGLPMGTFGHILASDNTLGEQLVSDDRIEAVAFTGSFHGGTTIVARAAARSRPIPVYAEMGSLNPLVVTADALRARGTQIADGLATSVASFGGQLCTKPGLVLVPAGECADRFISMLGELLHARSPEVLLSERIADAFASGIATLEALAGVARVTPPGSDSTGGYRASPVLFSAPAALLSEDGPLRDEHFGPAIVVLVYTSEDELRRAVCAIGGQLTATIHAEESEHSELEWLVSLCARQAGRVIFDGFPTGVSVCWAMQHGGPYPASSSAEATSVGMTSIRRFLRPVAFQNAPSSILHPALRDDNPLRIWQRVNGRLIRENAYDATARRHDLAS
jgi:acyl-CoA reductase-like NAD-dependent aldehyde dehydrogenase